MPALDGVQIKGLVLHNASWDKSRGCIVELDESIGNQEIPSLFLRPKERSQSLPDIKNSKNQLYQFDCPVYFCNNRSVRFETIVSLPCITLSSSLPEHVCRQRQVFLAGSSI